MNESAGEEKKEGYDKRTKYTLLFQADIRVHTHTHTHIYIR